MGWITFDGKGWERARQSYPRSTSKDDDNIQIRFNVSTRLLTFG
jgi:hypothetical protein